VALVKVLLKKLRTILQSKYLILFLTGLTTIMILIKITNVDYNYKKVDENNLIGVVTNISKNDYNIVLEINDTIVNTDLESKFVLGQKVECRGTVMLPNQNTNFYLFNYRNYLLSKKIYYQMNGTCNVINEDMSLLYKIKNIIIKRTSNLKSKGYIKAFILGDTKDIDDEVNKSYRLNGISHLFAISGMHVIFIVGVLSFLKKKIYLIIFLIFYMFLANFPISMIRAVIFFILMIINKKINLNISTILLFFYFTIAILWINPYYIYSQGFIYSFIISFYLILFSKIFNNNKLLNIFLLPIIVFLITIPINIQNNFYLNLSSIFLNVIFVPIISVVLFPLSFIVFIFPFLDSGYYFLWTIIEKISMFISENFSLKIIFCYIPFYAFLGYYALITIVMHKIEKKEYKYSILIFIVLLLHHNYIYIRNYGIIEMLEVGQGDSIIISYPNNKLNMLIDTGGKLFGDKSKSSIVEPITIPSLYSLGIKHIDYLVLTHGDIDHAGEALYLLKGFKVKKVLFNSGSATAVENEIIEYLEENNINYDFISEDIIIHNEITLNFINSKNIKDENEDSLVLLSSINNHSYLFMGDSGIKTEEEILMEYNLSNVDILKVGHHGSKNSSSNHFINSINPKVALISAGKNNFYNHPHEEVLKNLQFCDTYITSIHGSIKLRIDKNMLVTKVR
jgi:DNA internalization-related competence protein ComEC/Rec2